MTTDVYTELERMRSWEEFDKNWQRDIERSSQSTVTAPNAHQPICAASRSKNPLRPTTFDDVIGQARAVKLLRRVVQAAQMRDSVLDHMLFVGGSGTGKSTFSHVIAEEMGVDVYEIEAPISHDTLAELRTTMRRGDILRIEEIHQQAIMDRRGKDSSTQPEVLFSVMEDHVLQSPTGVLDFPEITIIGTTTDEGLLPDAFINRFPLRPYLEPYSVADMTKIARMNADVLGISLSDKAAEMFAGASRRIPRQVNNYVKNAASLVDESRRVNFKLASEVLHDLNRVTPDGLTADMQAMLVFLYTRAERVNGQGEKVYQASVSTIATAIGKSRDQKAIALRVEPYLIELGYVQVGHGGRLLTDAGVKRARQLQKGTR